LIEAQEQEFTNLQAQHAEEVAPNLWRVLYSTCIIQLADHRATAKIKETLLRTEVQKKNNALREIKKKHEQDSIMHLQLLEVSLSKH